MVAKHYDSSKPLRRGLWNTLFWSFAVSTHRKSPRMTTVMVNDYAVVISVRQGPLARRNFCGAKALRKETVKILKRHFNKCRVPRDEGRSCHAQGDICLPRGKNCRGTIFAPVLPLNNPHHEDILGIIWGIIFCPQIAYFQGLSHLEGHFEGQFRGQFQRG